MGNQLLFALLLLSMQSHAEAPAYGAGFDARTNPGHEQDDQDANAAMRVERRKKYEAWCKANQNQCAERKARMMERCRAKPEKCSEARAKRAPQMAPGQEKGA